MRTRRSEFFDELDRRVQWAALMQVVESPYRQLICTPDAFQEVNAVACDLTYVSVCRLRSDCGRSTRAGELTLTDTERPLAFPAVHPIEVSCTSSPDLGRRTTGATAGDRILVQRTGDTDLTRN